MIYLFLYLIAMLLVLVAVNALIVRAIRAEKRREQEERTKSGH
jgi:hypothetical protein